MSEFIVYVNSKYTNLLDYINPNQIMFENFILEEDMVRCIVRNNEGKLVTELQRTVKEVMSKRGRALNITGMERYNLATYTLANDVKRSLNHKGPVTIHMFISPTGAESFPVHTDPDTVILTLLKGKKIFEIEGKQFEMKIGEFYRIPPSAPHRAVYNEDSIMLSIGLEYFLEDKLLWKQE